ncbi:MAG: hypothetical protein ACREBG_04260 [Pyrinomonadaceae bacterium]
MIISLVLALFVTASGTITTYFYDESASLASRICSGACVGLTALGLVCFIFASFLGLNFLAIALSVLVLTIPFAALRDPTRRRVLERDLTLTSQSIRRALLHPVSIAFGYFLFYAGISVILWVVFSLAMIELPDGIYTGLLNNFGDLPFHLSVITSFAYGNNFPPEDPTYAGVRFTYPFLSDFVSAIFVRCGADLRQSMFIENFILGLSFIGLLHRWALELLRDRLAAIITPLLVILNGGFGWILLWSQVMQGNRDLTSILANLPSSFTVIPETSWRWGNAISTLLIPQRGILLGLPLAVIVFTQWWLATEEKATRGRGDAVKRRGQEKDGKSLKTATRKKEKSLRVPASPRLRVSSLHRMIAAGLVAGLLPLVHAHTFIVVMAVGGCLALGLHWRAWFAVALTLLLLIILNGAGYPILGSPSGKVFIVAAATGLAVALWFLLPRAERNLWYAFFLAAVTIALPQIWWSTHASAVNSSSFFAFEFGWDSGKEAVFGLKLPASEFLQTMPRLRTTLERAPDVAWFWLKNTGLFIPLIVVAILWRGKKRLISRQLLIFYLPFTLCFIVPNLVKMAPWVWDNIKVLFYWWLASAPLVALLLARLWQQGGMRRILALGLFACLTLAGGLDVASMLLRSTKYQVFDRVGIQFSEIVKQQTDPRALIIHAPVHNHPVFLTGRRSLMGYPGHIWTHGLDFVQREAEIKRFYAGSPDAAELLRKYGITHAVVGPLERNVANVNDQFFSRFTDLGGAGDYRLYKITQP